MALADYGTHFGQFGFMGATAFGEGGFVGSVGWAENIGGGAGWIN